MILLTFSEFVLINVIKGYDITISAHDGVNKSLSHDSNYIVDVVMLPTSPNSEAFLEFIRILVL